MLLLLFAAVMLPELASPLQGLKPTDIQDTFTQIHSGHAHEAIDMMSPRGTPVHAVVAGTIRKLFLSKPGGITIYEFDETQTWCFYYAHLDRYADGVKEGQHVKAGDTIGFVGSTGNANALAPHLHFAAFVLPPGKEWWKGEVVNPYAKLVEAVRR